MRCLASLLAVTLFIAGSPALAVSPWMVFFASNSARIDDRAGAVLDNVAASFRAIGIRGFRISGHADRIGPSGYNRELAQHRVEAVKTQLVRRGIPADVIETTAMGEDNPLVETPDGVGEPQNRRVEIVITCISEPTHGFDYMRCPD